MILSYFASIFVYTQQDYNDIVGGWKAKLVRSSSGEQRWGLFFAKKNWCVLLCTVVSLKIIKMI